MMSIRGVGRQACLFGGLVLAAVAVVTTAPAATAATTVTTTAATTAATAVPAHLAPVLPKVTSLCQPGTYSTTGSAPCTSAAAGHYVAGAGAVSQTACTAGTYQPATGQTSCLDVSAGHYQPGVGGITQYPCGPGSYQPSAGQAGCLPASPGYYVSGSAAIAQAACDPGSYRLGYGGVTCAPADPGSFVPGPASTTETPCPVGSFSATGGAAACTPAGIGFYVATTGSTSQTSCPPGTFTLSTGSTSAAACITVAVAAPGDQSTVVGTAGVHLADSVTDEPGPFTWSATGLPAGLAIDRATGTVTGTPVAVCDCAVTITAVDAGGHAGSTSFTWHVVSFGIVTSSLPGAVHGQAYAPIQLRVAGVGVSAPGYVTTVTWAKVALPKGMKLSPTGILAGVPSKTLVPGTAQVTVKVTEKVTTLHGTKVVRTRTTALATIPLVIS